jgi:CheY-like chemotaxis protein
MLSDIEMPHEDGYHLMEQIHALEGAHGEHMVAIAVTAHSRHEDRIRGLEVGFKWHLTKPVEPAELVAVVAALATRVLQR